MNKLNLALILGGIGALCGIKALAKVYAHEYALDCALDDADEYDDADDDEYDDIPIEVRVCRLTIPDIAPCSDDTDDGAESDDAETEADSDGAETEPCDDGAETEQGSDESADNADTEPKTRAKNAK